MEKEILYRNLVSQLKNCDRNYYLQKDKNIFLKIEETICYVLKYNSLPKKNVTFRCENISAIEWINQVKDYEEPLYVAFFTFSNSYTRNIDVLKLWQYKYDDFYDYVLKNKKLPLAYEKSFFDGTDMRKWYNTQLYRLQEKKTPLNDFRKECMEKLFALLKSFGITNKLMPIEEKKLSNVDKLKELYFFILENKKMPLETDKFSDETKMILFLNDVWNKKIVFSEKKQDLFNRLLFFVERNKKDEVIGRVKYSQKRGNFNYKLKENSPVIIKSSMKIKPIFNCNIEILKKPSMGSYLAYFRNCLHLKMKDMANLLQMALYHYIHIENNRYVFSYFRRMQFKVLLDRFENKDAILLEMQKVLDFSLQNENQLEYYLNQLAAMLLLNIGEERKEAYLFAKKYRIRKDVLPNRKFSLSKKVLLFTDLEGLEKIFLLSDEKQMVIILKKILKQDILRDTSHDELLNKTNICLGLGCTSISSIYTISINEAEHLLEFYENYRLRTDLTKKQVLYLDNCCYLLSCVL